MKLGTIRLLTRLRFHQFFRQKNKGRLVGMIMIVAYFWILELMVFFLLRKEGITNFRPLLMAIIFLSAIVPDFLIKLIFEHDQTVMDAFVRTRPISQGSWDRFLSLSQFWKASNLAMPIILAPACFLFMPFGWGFVLFLVLYLFSVFGGFLVMLLKHRGNYQPEKMVSASARSYRQGSGHHVFGIQSRSFLRSKRLKNVLFLLEGVFLFNFIIQVGFGGPSRSAEMYLALLLLLPPVMLPQYGLAVEANFFCGIWTKPHSISRLLTEKFLFSALLGGLTALVVIPFCLWFHLSIFAPLAYTLFAVGAGELFVLMDPYNCTPFDLFGKAFFNYQGASSTYKGSIIVGTFLLIGLPIVLPLLLPNWIAYLILAILGLAGILFHRPYFRWVERKFLKNRYKYMEKYLSI